MEADAIDVVVPSGMRRIGHSFVFLNRSAFEMTETELKLIAAPASMGLSSRPKNG